MVVAKEAEVVVYLTTVRSPMALANILSLFKGARDLQKVKTRDTEPNDSERTCHKKGDLWIKDEASATSS